MHRRRRLAFLVWCGVRTSAKAIVNCGVVAFAATVMWFYFSSVMDKLGRSLVSSCWACSSSPGDGLSNSRGGS
jgi:hypothetical protein